MKTIREQFEEIYPVLRGTHWCNDSGAYWMITSPYEPCRLDGDHNLRLETFTRCQESQAIVTSLNDDLLRALKLCNTQLCNLLDSSEYLSDDQFKAVELAAIVIAKAKGLQS